MALVELTRVGSVAVLELRNGKVNALSNALMEQLAATLSSIASENDVGAIVIRGSNKAFSGVCLHAESVFIVIYDMMS